VAVVGGEVQYVTGSAAQVMPMVKAGRLRPLAVMQKQRISSLPEVPSAPEAGLSELDYKTWFAMWGPAGMPPDVVAKFSAALKEVLAAAEIRAELDKGGVEPSFSSPQEFDACSEPTTPGGTDPCGSDQVRRDGGRCAPFTRGGPTFFGVIDPARLLALSPVPRRCVYGERDTMLYALGVGFGSDPMDEDDLRFVCESDGLKVAPTQATVLGWDRSWIPQTGIDWPKVIHGEQRIELGAPLAPAGEVLAEAHVSEVLYKGSGAVFRMQTRLTDAATGAWLCTSTTSFFVRDGGGFAPGAVPVAPRRAWPVRAPDAVQDVQTFPNAALLYRLSGDRNVHHAIPSAARAGGFERPLLHGLSTYGYACRSVLRAFCGYDPGRLAALDARFRAPVFPGDACGFRCGWRAARCCCGEVARRGRALSSRAAHACA